VEQTVRPLPRYTLAVMAAFVTFVIWIMLLGVVLQASFGHAMPAPLQPFASLAGLAVPVVVALALSDYLADRQGLFKPHQPKATPRAMPAGPRDEEPDEPDHR
jgi:purine-cytosine permease-like protein